jgi:hypothetical protein
LVSLSCVAYQKRQNEEAKKLKKYAYEKEKALKGFIPGKGYRYLLEYAKDGILDYSDVELARYNNSIREKKNSH